MQKSNSVDDIFDDIDFDAIDSEYEPKQIEQPPFIKPVPARILGGAVILSAVILVAAIVLICTNAMKQNSLHEQKSMQIARFVKPMVEADMQPFDDISNAESVSVLKACALYAIANDSGELEQNDSGSVVMPVYLMKSAANAMFGEDMTLRYYSFDINGLLFEYDSQNKCYLFPGSGFESAYTPKIVSYSEKNDKIFAVVKYLSDGDSKDEQYTFEITDNDGDFSLISIKK
ncbi:MAG: hypothetical protein ACI396_08990 [Acutalibacteraceae bacterium]